MQTGFSSLLLEFSNTLVAFAVAAIYVLWRPRDPSGPLYSAAQRWTVSQALLFFFGLDLVYNAASPLLAIRGSQFTEFAAWLAFQAVGPFWVWMFIRYLNQSLGTAGLASPARGIMQALQWLFGLVLAIAIAGAVAPPDRVAAAFYMEAYESGALYSLRLLVAASLAGLIEEIGYRGILLSIP
jgi:membrane protease YdiL (CAAX protease family)